MSVLSDFIDTYEPTQVVRLPLSAYLYDSNAVSGLARLVSDELNTISNSLSDYETREKLSTRVDTNELSAGVLSVDTAIFSVEHVRDYTVLNVNGKRFYNIGGEQVVQRVLPRRDLDARVTVFRDPASEQYFRLVAVVDDRSMVDPAAERNINIDVVRINPSDIDRNVDEIYDRVYVRVPGENERYSVKYLYISFSPDGEPQLNEYPVVDDLGFKLSAVADSIFFTGDSIKTNGSYPPCRIDVAYDGEQCLWPLPDSEYAQWVVEDEMRVLNSRTNSRINSFTLSVDSINADLSAFKVEMAEEVIALQDSAASFKNSVLSRFEIVNRNLSGVNRDINTINRRIDSLYGNVANLETRLTTETNRIETAVLSVQRDVEGLREAVDVNTETMRTLIDRLNALNTLSADCTVDDERLRINDIIGITRNL